MQLEVDGQAYFIDLLFYHLRLHCYFVPYSFVFGKPGGNGAIGLIQLLSQYLERCVRFSGQPERAADDWTRCFPFGSGQESCLRIGVAPTWLDEDIATSNRRPEQIERTERECLSRAE